MNKLKKQIKYSEMSKSIKDKLLKSDIFDDITKRLYKNLQLFPISNTTNENAWQYKEEKDPKNPIIWDIGFSLSAHGILFQISQHPCDYEIHNMTITFNNKSYSYMGLYVSRLYNYLTALNRNSKSANKRQHLLQINRIMMNEIHVRL